jgi:monovalent cation:H+ antiporter-2, CPA2 family
MHDITLLLNIGVALAVAFVGGMIARRLGLPTIVGYLAAGVLIGPFTPGFVGDVHTISQLAELGVIFLMFGVGIHFSLKDLWLVRDMAVPGAIGQMALSTAVAVGLALLWGWSLASGLVLGLAISIASTVVLLRGLMDNGLFNSEAGQVAVGWLVLEDLATVLILVLLPALSPANQGDVWATTGLALVKAAAFAALMLVVGGRVIPWVLKRVAFTQSRELFILTIVVIALGTAVGAAELFGVSLALGAFLAGVVVSGNAVSHQVEAEVIPFRETFAVLFFVSVGMLVNPSVLVNNIGQVLALTFLIVIGKAVISAGLGFLFPRPAHTALVVAAGLSQIGEFSFIVGQAGVSLGLLTQDQYSLILAGALLSIMVNPLMFRAIAPVEAFLQRYPALWNRINRHATPQTPVDPEIEGHVVIVGFGRVGNHIVNVVRHLDIPHLIIDRNAQRLVELDKKGVATLFGDAANSELLRHARLPYARVLVVTLPDEVSTELVVAAARQLAPNLHIIARAATQEGVKELAELGAQDVIQPELEGGLEIVRYTLLRLGFPSNEVQQYTDKVRQDNYEIVDSAVDEHRWLDQLIRAARGTEISWIPLAENSPILHHSLSDINLRARTGASIVAIVREQNVVPNPTPTTQFQAGDVIGLIGDSTQLTAASGVLNPV